MKTSGDGFLATFDSPARAVSCAGEIVDGVASLGHRVCAGVHTWECELRNDDVAGIAVDIASRVMHEAAAGEVLASSRSRTWSPARDCDSPTAVPTRCAAYRQDAWRLYALAR